MNKKEIGMSNLCKDLNQLVVCPHCRSVLSEVAERISTLSPLKGKDPASFTNENPVDDETL